MKRGIRNLQVTNEIVIGESEPDSALKLKTLYHEYAHSQLHGLTSEFRDRPREYKETQAEAVAYIELCRTFVLIQAIIHWDMLTWAQNKDVIHEALSEIQKVSNKVVDLSNKLTEKLGLEKEIKNSNELSRQYKLLINQAKDKGQNLQQSEIQLNKISNQTQKELQNFVKDQPGAARNQVKDIEPKV